jgi:hypothetical protein
MGKHRATPGYAETGHLSELLNSSPRRLLLLGVVVAAGALLYTLPDGRDAPTRAIASGGNFSTCANQRGEAARRCYAREVGLELAAVGNGSSLPVSFVAPSGSTGEVTFASAESEAAQDQGLLCDLHTRVGVTNEQVPAWLAWNEPQAAPAS